MEESLKLLEIGKTYEALERLKNILPQFEGNQDEWRIHELIGAAFHDIGDAEGAAQAYFNAAKCDKYLRAQRMHYSNYLFALHYLNDIDNDTLSNEHFIYNNLYEKYNSPFLNCNSSLTIGYIASNFLESSTARFYEALLTQYNRNDFIVKCFSLSNQNDKFTELVKSNVNKYIILEELPFDESAKIIADEGVDIIFDLSGHSDGGATLQILSYKPATVQICGIGWFDTTGLKAIDYILTDNYLAPIGHEKYFSEKLLRLSSAFAFKPNFNIKNNFKLSIQGSALTFGCFNNFMKITDEYLKCVKKILRQVENSRFIMQDTTTIPARKIEMERRIKSLNLPINRIEIRLGRDDYLKDYSEVDLILDTFPYNGAAMTATALCRGVPVISLYGKRHNSRFGADILRLAGLTELICNNTKDYVKLAISIANDIESFNKLKKTLQERLIKSKLLDNKFFIAELEYFYKRLVGKK